MKRLFPKAYIGKKFGMSPEEVFLDKENLPGFDVRSFEGTMEHPINRNLFVVLGFLFGVAAMLLLTRAGYLTLLAGSSFADTANRNHLRHRVSIPARGIIYDRNLQPIAFNVPGFRIYVHMQGQFVSAQDELVLAVAEATDRIPDELADFINTHQSTDLFIDTLYDWDTANRIIAQFRNDDRVTVEPTTIRSYSDSPALSHIVGYMSHVNTDDIEREPAALDWGVVGRAGLESVYEQMLRGTLGTRIIETNSEGNILSEGVFQNAEQGRGIVLTVSAVFEDVLYEALKETVEERGFTGGSAVVLDVATGEILGMASYPGFDMNVLTRGSDAEAIMALFANERNPLFNRAVAGLYPPASTIKPFLAMAAIEENVIRPEDRIRTEGRLIVPNPYDPDNPSIFKDWRNHGSINMREAIALSSNVYFYTIGGGFGSIDGLGHNIIADYFHRFGIGAKTNTGLPGEREGIVPDEIWKKERYPDNPIWHVGDTYNMSIGQGGVLVTPLQMARAVLTIANSGVFIEPYLLKGIITNPETLVVQDVPLAEKTNEPIVSAEALRVVREGMIQATQTGTASGLNDLPISVAAKTGTAELGKTGRVGSWFTGFAPVEHPEIVLVINMENGSETNLIGGTYVASQILKWYASGGREVIHGNTAASD